MGGGGGRPRERSGKCACVLQKGRGSLRGGGDLSGLLDDAPARWKGGGRFEGDGRQGECACVLRRGGASWVEATAEAEDVPACYG